MEKKIQLPPMIKVVHTAMIRAVPWYTCRKCGIQMNGSTVRMEFVNVHGISLDELVARYQIPRSHIPIGWCSDGADGVRCDKCKPIVLGRRKEPVSEFDPNDPA